MHSDYFFLTDDAGGFRLVLISTARLERRAMNAALWQITFASHDQRNAMCVWLAARRDQWSAWGRMAEAEGGSAIERHVTALLRADPPEVPVGVMLSPDADPRALTFSVTFGGRRHRPVVRHRFQSARALRRFLDWFHTDRNYEHGWSFAEVGLLRGEKALGELLDIYAAKSPPMYA